MNEQQVKELILQRFGSINAFSEKIQIPNSTLVSILERGFLNAKLQNVFAICKGLNLNPEDLESGFDFVRTLNYVGGDNNGVNGLDSGSGNMNTFNFNGTSKEQDKHNDSMKNLGVADLKLQRSLLNKLDKQITLAEETNILLTTLVEAEAENGRKLDLILDKINEL
ncbi:TPA: helix-turn-helix domain-containing protein [Streptococcus suis]